MAWLFDCILHIQHEMGMHTSPSSFHNHQSPSHSELWTLSWTGRKIDRRAIERGDSPTSTIMCSSGWMEGWSLSHTPPLATESQPASDQCVNRKMDHKI